MMIDELAAANARCRVGWRPLSGFESLKGVKKTIKKISVFLASFFAFSALKNAAFVVISHQKSHTSLRPMIRRLFNRHFWWAFFSLALLTRGGTSLRSFTPGYKNVTPTG